MATDTPAFSLTLPSDLRMLSLARSFVEAICLNLNLDRATTHAVVLATGEAVSNVIRHAHHGRPNAQVQLRCLLHPGALEIHLQDEGDPFDLSAVPHLDPGEVRLGGRGVFLMRALMDELTCAPCGTRGNVLRMVKRWAGDSPIRECG